MVNQYLKTILGEREGKQMFSFLLVCFYCRNVFNKSPLNLCGTFIKQKELTKVCAHHGSSNGALWMAVSLGLS